MGEITQVIREYDNSKSKKVTYAPGSEWQEKLKLNADGGIKVRSVVNAELYIQNDPQLKGLIAFDEFAEQLIKIKDAPLVHIEKGFWSDSDDSLIRLYLEKKYNLLFSKECIADAVIATSKTQSINPVKDRIESVEWDHKPRAEHYFIDYLGAENSEYIRMITKIWLTGAIARIYQPGIKFEIVPILEGEQGLGKSTSGRNLFPEKFNDSVKGLGETKDDYQQLSDSWIIEIAELSAMKRTDVDKVKNFISAQKDNYRNSYGRYATNHLRKCVFIGTTNQNDYLRDSTGERRFYPVRCGVTQPLKNIFDPDDDDIKQILAEAKYWYDKGEPIYPSKNDMNISKQYQEEAKLVDPVRDAVIEYLNSDIPTNWENLSISNKRSWLIYNMAQQPSLRTDKYDVTLKKLDKTTVREILEVLFDKPVDKYLTGKINSEAKKIKLILDNLSNFEYSEHLTINNKRVRGYRRKD